MREAIQFDHVAFGLARAADATPFLVGQLGGQRHEAGPGSGFRFWQWQFAGGGVIELIEPDGPPDGFLHRFLAARGPGIHHVTFKVPDIHRAAERARAAGYDVVGLNDSFPGWQEAFLHPRQAQGLVVQLAHHDPGFDDGVVGAWPFPPEPAPARAPARLVGLLTSARDADRARRQWSDLLGGHAESDGDRLVFRWPESPLRVSVQVAPEEPEGPCGIEIVAAGEAPLPSGPHPVLGAPFLSL